MQGALLYTGLIGGGVAFGLLIGRWWAVLIPLVAGVILFERTPRDGNDLAAVPLVLGFGLAVGVLIGVALRKLRKGPE